MKCHLEYSFTAHPEGFEAEKDPLLDSSHKAEAGGCTSAVLLSTLHNIEPYGAYGVQIKSIDGRTNEELSDKELWQVWMLFTQRLAKSKTLGEGHRQFCEITFESLCRIFFGQSEEVSGITNTKEVSNDDEHS